MLIALAVLAGLVALVASVATTLNGDLKSESDRMIARRAQAMADSGIQQAIDQLQNLTGGVNTLSDSWATLGNKGASDYAVGADTFRIQIIDSCAKINLNTAGTDMLAKLPLTSDQTDSLQDWRESKADPRPSGAKDEYYNKLTKPYNTKLQPLGSFDELLQIKGFTPSTLFDRTSHPSLSDLAGTDSISEDLDPNGNPKIDVNSMTSSQLSSIGVTANVANSIVQLLGSFQKMGDVLGVQGMDQASAKALLNYCRIGSPQVASGLINVNTAPEAVLDAVPNLDPDVASAIVTRQQDGFKGLGDLVDVPGFEISTLSKVVDLFCVSSRSFEIRVIGFAAGSYCAVQAEAILDDKGNATIIRQQPSSLIDPSKNWGWPPSASDHETLAGVW